MVYLVKSSQENRVFKVHQANANHAPLCGGGNAGKANIAWQEDIGPANCQLCAYQLRRKKKNENTVTVA